MRSQFDSTLSDLEINQPEENIGIPFIDDFRSDSAISYPDLFYITGKAQTYKTTLSVEILRNFLEISPKLTGIWIDCDFKFPTQCIIDKSVDIDRLQRIQCKCSEQILFSLKKIMQIIKS